MYKNNSIRNTLYLTLFIHKKNAGVYTQKYQFFFGGEVAK